mgnify:CR=1 FL=1|jgi:O-antigen ligase
MKKSINLLNIFWYIEAIAFLFPSGFDIYFPEYKKIETIILFFALALGVLRIFYEAIISNHRMIFNAVIGLVLLYHLTLLMITLCIQGSVSEGFKKIFSVPIICLLLSYDCKSSMRNVINAFSKVLIIILLLNILFFNQWLFKSYFLVDNHIIFIGHVQIASELGILGILIAYAESKVNGDKFNGILLLALSIITMLYSKTSASYLVLSILIIAWIFKKNTFIRGVVNKYTGLIVLFLMLIGTYLVFNDWMKENLDTSRLVTNLTSGRTFVWLDGVRLFRQSPLIGYGAYGFKIVTFWSQWINGGVGSYAHSTLLQLLLDGGIILASIFIIMIFVVIKKEKNSMVNNDCKYLSYVLLIAFLAVGLFESLTEYCYIFIFLFLMLNLENTNSLRKRTILK